MHYQDNANPDGRLSDQNRGAQMMKKMGWGGAGLGSAEQGIQVLYSCDNWVCTILKATKQPMMFECSALPMTFEALPM